MTPAARDRWGLGVVLLLAAAVRLAAYASFAGDESLHGDERDYAEAARALAAGEPLPDSRRAPGYPFFAALVLRAFPDGGVDDLRMAQVIVSLIGLAFLFDIVRRGFGRRAAAASALLCALHPTLIHYSLLLYSETLVIALLLLFFWCFDRHLARGRMAWLLAATAALAACILTREMFLYFTPVVAALAAGAPRARRLRNAAVVVVGVALLIAPWVVRNYRVHRAWVPVSTIGWFALAEGNLPPGEHWLFGEGRTLQIKGGSELEQQAIAQGAALDAIRAQGPTWLPRKLVRNTYHLFTPRRTQLARSSELAWLPPRLQRAAPALVRLELVYSVGHLLVGILALWLVPGGRLKLLLVFLLAFCLAIYIAANAIHRYRVPLLPLFSLYAGPLLCGLWTPARWRSWRAVGAAATLALFLAITGVALTLDPWQPRGKPKAVPSAAGDS